MRLLSGALIIKSVFQSSPFHGTVNNIMSSMKSHLHFSDKNEHYPLCAVFGSLGVSSLNHPGWNITQSGEVVTMPGMHLLQAITVSKFTTQHHSCLLSLANDTHCMQLLCYAYSWQWSMASCTIITINAWIACYIESRMFLKGANSLLPSLRHKWEMMEL